MGMVLAGGIVGFWAAVAGLVLFGLSPLAALAIWAGSGPAAAAVVVDGRHVWRKRGRLSSRRRRRSTKKSAHGPDVRRQSSGL